MSSEMFLRYVLKGVKNSCGVCPVPRFYATSPKPLNITRSLHKWKKKKRKSKAQQKRELEKLQQDLFDVLSKRVVRLAHDGWPASGRRDVVNTYSFTHLLRSTEEGHPYSSNFDSLSGASTRKEHHVTNHHTQTANKPHGGYSPPASAFKGFPPFNSEQSSHFAHQRDSSDFHVCNLESFSNEKHVVSDAVKNFLEKRDAFQGDYSVGSSTHLSTLSGLQDVFTSARQDKIMKPVICKSDVAFSPVDFVPKVPPSLSAEETFPAYAKIYQVDGSEGSLPFHAAKSRSVDLNASFSQTLQVLKQNLTETHSYQYPWEDFSVEPSATSTSDSLHPGPETDTSISATDSGDTLETSSEFPPAEAVPAAPVSSLKTSEKDPEKLKKSAASAAGRKKLGKTPDRRVKSIINPQALLNPKFKELCDMSYVDVCCFSGCEKLAVRYLKNQSSRSQHPAVPVYNRVIRALAKKQSMSGVKFVFTMLKKSQQSPSLQTYAGCLECIGRMADPDLILCDKLVSEIEDSLVLTDIANSCSFEGDEWDHVLKAIHLVRPDFVPQPPPIKSEYDSGFLQKLNIPNPERLERNQYAIEMEKEEMMQRLGRQMEMEKVNQVQIPSINVLSEKEEKKLESLIAKQKQVADEWRAIFCTKFSESLKMIEKKAENNMRITVYPYLKLFPPEVYADIVIQHLEELAFLYDEMFSPSQNVMHIFVGRAVNRRYNMVAKVAGRVDEKVEKIYDKYADQFLDRSFVLDNHRLMWARAMREDFDTVGLDTSIKKWPRPVLKGIGKHLLDLVIQNLKVNGNEFRPSMPKKMVPAFCTIYRPDVTTYTVAEMKFHPVVSKLFGPRFRKFFTFDPSVVPMVTPPVPWISKTMGSLLLGSSSLVRTNDDNSHLDPLEGIPEAQYSAVLDSLNALGACAWKMNTPILDLQIEIFNSGGDAKLKVPPPSTEAPPMPTISSQMSGYERATLYRERLNMLQQKNDMHSLWCTDLYRLSIANKFRDEVFWFPHSMDFRGRTYPLPPHFNHLGSDNMRAMLLFAKGKPLGSKGHDWLKIHLVNLTGLKKRRSNAERLAFANSIMDDILDSADNPLTGRGWWQRSDEPWQTLACCMELANIERFEGNKEDYVSCFPVHQDGSCNGLQHYAALGRDKSGAESVNLTPSEQPQDVYSDVVVLVEKARKKDADNGVDVAKALEGFVKRKVIKQPVMTTVYGVTRFGAKHQIFKQLKDIPELSAEFAWKSSIYLTEKTFSCLGEMFTATKDIQDWLTHTASLMSAYLPVEWVTPLGFPVVQPYFKKGSEGTHAMSGKPNTFKQRNAFPPNYIHSLDSTHMMLTSLFCMHAGTTFVSVHDCFWTHAADVMTMNQVCREQFVSMHNQPLLESLSKHLSVTVKQGVPASLLDDPKHAKKVEEILELLQDIPKRGDFNLNDVLKSTYFFS